MLRAPNSVDKLQSVADSGTVVHRSKRPATLKRDFQVMPGAKWLELLLQHSLDKCEHLKQWNPLPAERSPPKDPGDTPDWPVCFSYDSAVKIYVVD